MYVINGCNLRFFESVARDTTSSLEKDAVNQLHQEGNGTEPEQTTDWRIFERYVSTDRKPASQTLLHIPPLSCDSPTPQPIQPEPDGHHAGQSRWTSAGRSYFSGYHTIQSISLGRSCGGIPMRMTSSTTPSSARSSRTLPPS